MQTKYPIQKHSLFVLLISIALITGCSSQKLIPDTGEQIIDIYKQHVGSTDSVHKMFREVRNNRKDLKGYTRDSSNEISQSFPMLPNPELSIYVFPHLSRKGHPVPGYSSSYLMYEKNEYAMPGELVR